MATYNLNVTASVDLLGSDISGSQSTDFAIANSLPVSSYFTFETVRNSDGFYDSSSPKNMAGTYTLGAGLTGVVKSDYIASVIVQPGGGTLTFVPTNYISGSSLNLRGTTSPPAPTGTSFDVDAQAFFDRVTTAGGTLSTTEQDAVNTLVVQMKNDGIWNAMKAVYPMVGASAAACAQNLKSSSFTGTFTAGWAFASTGVTPNGTSAYMDTGFNPTLHLTNQIESHLSLYSRTQKADVNRIDIGSYQVSSGHPYCASMYYLGEVNKFAGHKGAYPANFTRINNNDTTGFLFSTRRTNSELNLFQDGVKLVSNTTTLTTQLYPNLNSWVGGYNRVPGSSDRFSFLEVAFASFGDGLTDTEASDFYTAVQAFQTTLSRQV